MPIRQQNKQIPKDADVFVGLESQGTISGLFFSLACIVFGCPKAGRDVH
jgi:hypothetical protein